MPGRGCDRPAMPRPARPSANIATSQVRMMTPPQHDPPLHPSCPTTDATRHLPPRSRRRVALKLREFRHRGCACQVRIFAGKPCALPSHAGQQHPHERPSRARRLTYALRTRSVNALTMPAFAALHGFRRTGASHYPMDGSQWCLGRSPARAIAARSVVPDAGGEVHNCLWCRCNKCPPPVPATLRQQAARVRQPDASGRQKRERAAPSRVPPLPATFKSS